MFPLLGCLCALVILPPAVPFLLKVAGWAFRALLLALALLAVVAGGSSDRIGASLLERQIGKARELLAEHWAPELKIVSDLAANERDALERLHEKNGAAKPPRREPVAYVRSAR